MTLAQFVATTFLDGADDSLVSDDGLTWVTTDLPAHAVSEAAYSTVGGFWLIAPDPSNVYTSTDGHTWTQHTPTGLDYYPDRLCYSPDLDQFLATSYGVNGGTHSLWTSTDGIAWTSHTNPLGYGSGGGTSGLFAIAWSPDLGLWVIGGGNPTSATQVATSLDGAAWTTHALPQVPASQLQDACWFPGAGIFVVGDGGSGYVWISSDGSTWTRYATGLGHIVWALAANDDVIVANGGDTAGGSYQQVATSPDGVTWTLGAMDTTTYAFANQTCNAWSENLGLFAAGGGGTIQTSADGVTWTDRDTSSRATRQTYMSAIPMPADDQGIILGSYAIG